jgi:hypothetical protein
MPKLKSAFLDFVRLVVNGEIDDVSRCLAANPSFAAAPALVGVARHGASASFFTEIAHYLYAGDTGHRGQVTPVPISVCLSRRLEGEPKWLVHWGYVGMSVS